MTSTEAAAGPPIPVPGRAVRRGGTSLRVGAATLWLSVIVLLPLAAIVWQSAKGGWPAFWAAVTSTAAVESFKVTLSVSVA
ncbi:MAG TPA: molybdate ABC transporter permease subunit, partial [Mycolicibacterium fallax]|nr:molybdate ABC transporter permease subunit [Mycolicibacterium fallax]